MYHLRKILTIFKTPYDSHSGQYNTGSYENKIFSFPSTLLLVVFIITKGRFKMTQRN